MDRTKYVCIAIPVSTMAGSKAFYVDEAIALWEFDQGDDPPDYTGSHINWAAPPGVELEGGERRLQLGEYLLERK
ncbi:MAG: hypothetical protein U5N86_03655 [Planctomycetota bacterium]|nr:hypothetical protein [Planctomycetota bacterium]